MSSVKNQCNKALNHALNQTKLNNSWTQNLDESSTSGIAMTSEDSEVSATAVIDELIDYETFRGPSALVNTKICYLYYFIVQSGHLSRT